MFRVSTTYISKYTETDTDEHLSGLNTSGDKLAQKSFALDLKDIFKIAQWLERRRCRWQVTAKYLIALLNIG